LAKVTSVSQLKARVLLILPVGDVLDHPVEDGVEGPLRIRRLTPHALHLGVYGGRSRLSRRRLGIGVEAGGAVCGSSVDAQSAPIVGVAAQAVGQPGPSSRSLTLT
jgi:hypothetical protein